MILLFLIGQIRFLSLLLFCMLLCFTICHSFVCQDNSSIKNNVQNHNLQRQQNIIYDAINPPLFLSRSKPTKILLFSKSSRNGVSEESTLFVKHQKIPKHVAFICDGNSRWAKARNLPTSMGHVAGADRLVEILDALKDSGVLYCTMYGFSTENWKRPEKEIHDILAVMEETARRFSSRAIQEKVRVKILGDVDDDRIPNSLRQILQSLEEQTLKVTQTIKNDNNESNDNNNDDNKYPTPLTVCLAVNYGGRNDIVHASKKLATMLSRGEIEPSDITEDTISSLLCTSGIPDPDLIIRTSGECRLSNFLLWDSAYSEIYFTNTLWPDFDISSWKDALSWYSQRKRRFGARESSLSSSLFVSQE